MLAQIRCGHCDNDIRYWQRYAVSGSQLFHVTCLAEAMADAAAIREGTKHWHSEKWPEDWELEARRHDDVLNGRDAAAHAYHIERGL